MTVIIRTTVTMSNEFADIKLAKNIVLIPYISYIFFHIFYVSVTRFKVLTVGSGFETLIAMIIERK